MALLALLPAIGVRRAEVLALWRTATGVLTALCTAIYQVCFFAGVERAGVAVGTLIAIGSGPVLTGLLARWLLAERGLGECGSSRPGCAWPASDC
jgi:DME family drug/metabolite transporter